MPLPYTTAFSAYLDLLPTESIFCANHKFSTFGHKNHEENTTRWIWRHVDAVCFDVDSTVCEDEAIDELANFCGVGAQVAELTRVAMNGNVTFRQALTTRLNLMHPSRQQVQDYIAQNPPKLTPGIVELCRALRNLNIPIFLVTGGFKSIVEPVAALLGIPSANIFANVLLFNETTGSYAGFDLNQPTSDSGGKAAVCNRLKQNYRYRRLVMVGDGATDLETSPPADAFVGFGGNVRRPAVLQGAKWFVESFDELRCELRKAA